MCWCNDVDNFFLIGFIAGKQNCLCPWNFYLILLLCMHSLMICFDGALSFICVQSCSRSLGSFHSPNLSILDFFAFSDTVFLISSQRLTMHFAPIFSSHFFLLHKLCWYFGTSFLFWSTWIFCSFRHSLLSSRVSVWLLLLSTCSLLLLLCHFLFVFSANSSYSSFAKSFLISAICLLL